MFLSSVNVTRKKMTLRLTDLERLTKDKWSSPHQWRYHEKNIEFGIDSSHGIQWFPYCQAPESIEKMVKSYIKMQPKIGLR